jgi:hypothetical protein
VHVIIGDDFSTLRTTTLLSLTHLCSHSATSDRYGLTPSAFDKLSKFWNVSSRARVLIIINLFGCVLVWYYVVQVTLPRIGRFRNHVVQAEAER